MNSHIIDWSMVIARQYPQAFENARVLEVGSRNINGTIKDLFKNGEYIGIDFIDGPDVDKVMNAHDLAENFEAESFDTIICMDMLEHDDKFWLSLEAINKVIKKGGYFITCVPTYYFPVHNYPDDYWRFGESAFKQVVYEGYELLNMETVFTKTNDRGEGINPIICAIGKKI